MDGTFFSFKLKMDQLLKWYILLQFSYMFYHFYLPENISILSFDKEMYIPLIYYFSYPLLVVGQSYC